MNEIIRAARITSTTNLGAGVLRLPGAPVVFVDDAVAGDVADVEITRASGSYAEGRIVRLVEKSEHRITPDCPVFPACGGCMFRHVSYEHELAVKADYIKTAMRKCGIEIEPGPFLTAGPDAVRSKVTAPVSGTASGYYARGSHDIVPCRRCLLHDEETDAIRTYLAEANVAGLHHVTVRRAAEGTMVILRCDASDEDIPVIAGLRERFPFVTSVWREAGGEYEHISGERAIWDTLSGCRFKISPDSFYQVNHDCAELLYRRAIEAAELSGGECVADLYCGTGTIGIAAARSADIELSGIEINASAVADARENAAANGVRAHVSVGDAAEYKGGADVVILDPPRAGCDKRLIAQLCRVRPRRIVYVSCEPATLARDAARLAEAGYRVTSVTPVDMFPRTGKVECVAEIVRGQP